MLSTYCQSCGSKNEYRFDKPKFCSNCGSPLDPFVKIEQKTSKKVQKNKAEVEEDEDGLDIYEVPDIQNLDVEIDMSDTNSFTLGSLFKNESQAFDAPNIKENGVDPEKIMGRPKKLDMRKKLML